MSRSTSFHPLLLFFVLLTTSSFFPSPSCSLGSGYRAVTVSEHHDGGGLVALLELNDATETFGPDIQRLQLYVKHETESRLRVHITDAEKPRWEVPYNLLPRSAPPPPLTALNITPVSEPNSFNYDVAASTGSLDSDLSFGFNPNPFGFWVTRKSDGITLFNSTEMANGRFGPMVFKDQYIEISTSLPESGSNLYGLGENTQPGGIRLRPNDPYTIYTTDISAINLNADLYGSHPYYMELRNNINGGGGDEVGFHGVLLLNSNAMDVVYRGNSLTYKVIGGLLDFYFFAGPSVMEVMNQYTSFIGRPAPMPYWAFGFHQCRWGYHNISQVAGVVENYRNAAIPLDVMWTDDDHMDAAKDFTLDPVHFPAQKMQSFLTNLHNRGMKYIVLIDPGINVNQTYGTYRRGMSSDVYIKLEGNPYLAQVWPGPVYFPDFLNPRTVSWWIDEIGRFRQIVPVDGLWIDMNEPSNFCTGKCVMPKDHSCPTPKVNPWECCLDCTNLTTTRWDNPPYKINASGQMAPLGFKTIAASATHYNGVLEYNAHSLYGFSQTIATHKGLLASTNGKRPFILTRSTFVGSGQYAAHWTGDNKGDWDNLRYSISTILNFGIFGMPMVGSDICGFYPSPTEELCNRWIELGAFYPFSRDHANLASPPQELYAWSSVAQSARNALGMRYRLLPYFYTLNYQAHTTGAPMARPVFFSFPTFVESYNLSTQFLLGNSVLVSPVLQPNTTTVKALFPPGTWYNLFDVSKAIVSKGEYAVLNAPLHVVNVHLYQNTILPMQRGGLVSRDARKTPFTLVVTFPSGAVDSQARGSVFVDDDEDPVMALTAGKSTYVDLFASIRDGEVKVYSKVSEGDYAGKLGLMVERIMTLGLDGNNGAVSVDGLKIEVDGKTVSAPKAEDVTVSKSEFQDAGMIQGTGEVDGKNGVMVQIGGLNLPLGKEFSLTWKVNING